MYAASRITPVQRMRRQSSTASASSSRSTRAISPAKQSSSRRNSSSTSNSSGIHHNIKLTRNDNGDYQVLRQNVDRDRQAVQDARIALATSLDQLGEHHVRHKEYDDAMDAFTEALREKRSVFWHMTHSSSHSRSLHNNSNHNNNATTHSRGSSFNSSFLSGTTASTTVVGDEDESTTFSNKDPARQDALDNIHDKAIDELVATLKNMGNVHSLRGEQDEAMRYFTEVTTLRAQKKGSPSNHNANGACDASVDTRSFLSGLNDENSALMSEINEDVKALDDLFRSISFRNNNGDVAGGTSEKRKSKSGTPSNKKHKGDTSPRLSNSSQACNAPIAIENEPFDRSTATSATTLGPSSTSIGDAGNASLGNEASEAMEMYKNALDNYAGPSSKINQHREMLNSLALRIDLLNENQKKMLNMSGSTAVCDGRHTSPASRAAAVAEALYSNPDALSTKAADLELSLEIYKYVLLAHKESQASISPLLGSIGSMGSNDSVSSATSKSITSLDFKQIQRLQQDSSQSGSHDADINLQQQQVASNIASTLICMGSVYYKLGNRIEELRMYQEAKRVYRKAFGENHTFVAGTRKNIGMVLAERGEYDEAMRQFEMAMRIYLAVNTQTSNGSDTSSNVSVLSLNSNMLNRDVASAISCMGNVKNRVGELDAALFKYMQALQIYKALYHQALMDSNSSCSPATTEALRDVTSTLKVIGMVHAKKGDLDTAMKFFQEAMALLRTMEVASAAIAGTTAATTAVTGTPETSSHAANVSATEAAEAVVRETTASVLTRIASIFLKKGDLDSAMSHYRDAYNMTIHNRGTTNHPEVAGILHYIGGIYHKRADYDEAMSCYQESIRIYHSTLGPGNPTVAGTLVMVGSIHYKRRHLDSAMMFYREALRLNRDAYGMHHPDVAPILKSIGTILTKKGEYEEAYDIFRDVLSIKCTVHGTDHPEVASAYKSLGNVHYKLGDLADAERQYRHALSIYRRCKGEEHADTVAAKTTIEHLRYWMRERDQRRQMERRQTGNSSRHGESVMETDDFNDERSC